MYYLELTGVMELPISQLCAPPKQSRLLKEADTTTFMAHLKKIMLADPAAPACPMAIFCKDKTDPVEGQRRV